MFHSAKARAIKQGISTIAAIYLVLMVVYGNVAVILNDSPLKTRLPSKVEPLHLNNIFAVFAFYETYNIDVFIQGLPAPGTQCGSPGKWLDLDVNAYFPYPRGAQHMRVWLPRHLAAGGSAGQQQALKQLARKIQEKHNRETPQCLINKVRIGEIRWPRSTKGYYALKTPRASTVSYWLKEGP